MKYNLFSINILDSKLNNFLDNSKKFIYLKVTYELNKFPLLHLKIYSLQRINLSFTDLIIKINYNDYFYNFNMGILESKYVGNNVYEFKGVNLPYKFIAQNNSRYLSDSLLTSFNIIGSPYSLDIKTDLKSNFYQINQTDISILEYLISGISEGVPVSVSDKNIQLINNSSKYEELVSESMSNIIIRNKFLNSNVNINKLDNFIYYQGLKDNIFVNKSSQSEFYKNRLINKQFIDGLTRISLLLSFKTSPKKNVGDKIKVPNAYVNNLLYTIISKEEEFTELEITTNLIIGANEI